MDAGKRAEAMVRWERLDGSICPSCGADGRESIALQETFKDENFTLQEGGWVEEWYRCDECGAQIGVSRRFVPAGGVEVKVEGR